MTFLGGARAQTLHGAIRVIGVMDGEVLASPRRDAMGRFQNDPDTLSAVYEALSRSITTAEQKTFMGGLQPFLAASSYGTKGHMDLVSEYRNDPQTLIVYMPTLR